ncbi:mitochondrial thiamine pyrophosphate carrier-like [Lytechinus variegatus]|uniref:mitochondrial thiamine pyrophosphate carrier-like n=1 Tax=Lytechinus variegatus TaxID=7654 RepID=UPI001BB0D8DC|nr:mitochondrial thiamine pyrophosphate carrier-like [Lytechinus variegatus]
MVGYTPSASAEIDKGQHRQLTKVDYGFAGAASGAFTRACLQPLDVLKIRFQLQEEPMKRGVSTAKYNSILQAVGSIIKEEGPQSLWKGHVPAQALSIIYGIAQFVTFEGLTYMAYPLLPEELTTGVYKPVYHFVCGGVSGCVATLVSLPVDVLRTRLVSQGEPKIYKSISHALRSMYMEAGIRTFYKGLTPTMILLFPQTGFQFGFYALFTRIWKRAQDMTDFHQLSGFQSLLCGGLAGVCAKSGVYPLDVIKKRLQVQGFEEARRPFGRVTHYSGFLHCTTTIAKQEGMRGLFKGLSPSLLKAFFSVGLNFAAYEKCCQWLARVDR